MQLDNAFTNRLKWALELRDPPCSQSELARHLSMSPQAIQQWTSGATSNPRRDKLLAASAYLGVRFEWLAYARGPMKDSDDREPAAKAGSSEEVLLAREWHQAFSAALPEGMHGGLDATVAHPNGTHRFRVDYVDDQLIAEVGLYRSPAGVIKGRAMCWLLVVARELLPIVPGRRMVLILSPLEDWKDAPERHVEALRAEARTLGIEVVHVRNPVEAASVIAGTLSQPPVPTEDELGLDTSSLL